MPRCRLCQVVFLTSRSLSLSICCNIQRPWIEGMKRIWTNAIQLQRFFALDRMTEHRIIDSWCNASSEGEGGEKLCLPINIWQATVGAGWTFVVPSFSLLFAREKFTSIYSRALVRFQSVEVDDRHWMVGQQVGTCPFWIMFQSSIIFLTHPLLTYGWVSLPVNSSQQVKVLSRLSSLSELAKVFLGSSNNRWSWRYISRMQSPSLPITTIFFLSSAIWLLRWIRLCDGISIDEFSFIDQVFVNCRCFLSFEHLIVPILITKILLFTLEVAAARMTFWVTIQPWDALFAGTYTAKY